jgi:MFS family permease
MLSGSLLSAIVAPLALWLISSYKDPFIAFLAQTVFGICLSIFGGPMTAWMVESFPPEARLTSMSIGYNIAQCIMGGTSPVISTKLVDLNPVAPGFFISVAGLMAFVGVYTSKVSDPDRIKMQNVYGKGGKEETASMGLLKESYEGEEEGKEKGLVEENEGSNNVVIVDI